MTKRERARIVEILRCAADCLSVYGVTKISQGFELAASWPQHWRAVDAWQAVDGTDVGSLLEAALRVEEGSWP